MCSGSHGAHVPVIHSTPYHHVLFCMRFRGEFQIVNYELEQLQNKSVWTELWTSSCEGWTCTRRVKGEIFSVISGMFTCTMISQTRKIKRQQNGFNVLSQLPNTPQGQLCTWAMSEEHCGQVLWFCALIVRAVKNTKTYFLLIHNSMCPLPRVVLPLFKISMNEQHHEQQFGHLDICDI